MTKPKDLDKFRQDRGWSKQKLADRIYDLTRIRLTARTIDRFIDQSHRPSEITQNTIDKFMAAARTAQELR